MYHQRCLGLSQPCEGPAYNPPSDVRRTTSCGSLAAILMFVHFPRNVYCRFLGCVGWLAGWWRVLLIDQTANGERIRRFHPEMDLFHGLIKHDVKTSRLKPPKAFFNGGFRRMMKCDVTQNSGCLACLSESDSSSETSKQGTTEKWQGEKGRMPPQMESYGLCNSESRNCTPSPRTRRSLVRLSFFCIFFFRGSCFFWLKEESCPSLLA